LSNPKSFTRRDFEPLLKEYEEIIADLRVHSPSASQSVTPPEQSRRPSIQAPTQETRQTYWNEYDDGSEADNEPYTLYIDPDADSSFPGSKTMSLIYAQAKVPIDKVKALLGSTRLPEDQRPLLESRSGSTGYFTEQTETDAEDEAYASSSDFPLGYATHYATFPSVQDQKFLRYREEYLFRTTIASFMASTVLMVISGLLIVTGRHRLRIEVDAGAIVGVVASLFFGTLGFGTMIYQSAHIGWIHQLTVIFVFAIICLANAFLLVLVSGNTRL
jgi:hypothetical protein